jgi:hypothetical protein
MAYEFRAELWRWPGDAAWIFATLPTEVADDIEDDATSEPRGFGSRRVEVSIGGTTWRTSIFPDAKAGSFLLPVKKDVRRREGIDEGDEVSVRLELL